MSERKTDRKHSSSNRSESGESYRSHRSGSGGDAYRREVDTDSLAPPSSYHNGVEPQVATRSSYGRSPSELQVVARARSQYTSSRPHMSGNDGRRLYSSAAKQRKHLAIGDNEDIWETSTQATNTSKKDRVGSVLGKNKNLTRLEKPESLPRHRLTPSSRLPSWRSDYGQRGKSYSQVDNHLNRGMARLEALKEEELDGSIIDLEPGRGRRLMPPSQSTQQWVDCLPLTEQAVATFNARPGLGQRRAQSDIPVYNRRMMSQERFPQSIAPGDSAFSTIEPYEEPQTRPELSRAPNAAPTSHTAKSSIHSEAPSYRTVDPQERIHGAQVKSSKELEDSNLSLAIQNSLRDVGSRQSTRDGSIAKGESHSLTQLHKQPDNSDAAMQESMRSMVVTSRGKSKGVEKGNSRPDVGGWDEDEIAAAIAQSTHDLRMNQQNDDAAFGKSNDYLATQNREHELAGRRLKEASNAARRLQELNDAASRQRDAEDSDRRQRDAEDDARRKQEADHAVRQHEARRRELDYEIQAHKQEIADQARQAEHAARMRELELVDRERQLVSDARKRDAEIALEQRQQEKRLAEKERCVADTLSQLENQKRESEKELAENQQQIRLQALSGHRNSTSAADSRPPPYNAWSNEDMAGALPAGYSTYPLPPQSPATAVLPVGPTPQVNVQSHLSITQSAPTSQRIHNNSHPQQQPSQIALSGRPSGEIYRPPRRIGNIMPDSITRIQQHYRFRRSLIERNVQEGRRTAEQGRAAIACLNRNEVADIDSEPRRSQELNVVGLEAFEADIELLDRLGGDQMAPPVPWAIPSLETQSRGNFNQAHLREHIESLLAQQDGNVTASSRTGPLGLGLPSAPSGGYPYDDFMPVRGAQYFEWYEEYRL